MSTKTSWLVLVEDSLHAPVNCSCEAGIPDDRDMAFPATALWMVREWVEAVPRDEVLGKKLNSVPGLPAPGSFLPAFCSLSFAQTLGFL